MYYAASMAEREQHITGQPEHENGERQRELAWLEENRPFFYAASAVAAEQIGRGALIIDTTIQMPHGGHPMSYQAEGEIEPDNALHTLLQEYDPHREFVVTLLKPEGQTSTHRGTAPEAGWWEDMETQTAISERGQGKPTEIPKALFELGQIVVTRGAAEETNDMQRHPVQLIARHVEGPKPDR